MKPFLARASAAVLVAVTTLTTACSNDPTTAPQAPSQSRTPSSALRSNSVGSVAVSGNISVGGDTGGATTQSGYMISYGRGDQSAPPQGQ